MPYMICFHTKNAWLVNTQKKKKVHLLPIQPPSTICLPKLVMTLVDFKKLLVLSDSDVL